MITSEQISLLAERLAAAHSVLVLLPAQPSFDHLAAGLGLTQLLLAQGKEVQLASPEELESPIAVASLIGVDLLKQQLGNQNLQVSFAYRPEQVDKVSYHIDETQQRFHLVIKPQKGVPPLDASTVQMEYTGAEAEVVFLIGIHEWTALEHLYQEFETLYQQATVVTLHTFEPEIGTIKLNISGYSGMAEAVGFLALQLQFPLAVDAATNLLQGIEETTDGFRSLATTAETFDLVAQLLRAGARRVTRVQPEKQLKEPAPTVTPKVIEPTEVVVSPTVPPTTPPARKNEEKTTHPTAVAGNTKKKQKPKNDSVQPGSLKYQPTGFGPSGGG